MFEREEKEIMGERYNIWRSEESVEAIGDSGKVINLIGRGDILRGRFDALCKCFFGRHLPERGWIFHVEE